MSTLFTKKILFLHFLLIYARILLILDKLYRQIINNNNYRNDVNNIYASNCTIDIFLL